MIVSSIRVFALLLLVLSSANAAEDGWKHALSLSGTPKYQPGFTHFDYVNPDAPKGGQVRLGVVGTFDNFNPVVSGIKGNTASGLDDLYDTLLSASKDEVSTEYGLLAESVKIEGDFAGVIYRLRSNAKWHDGKAVSVDDVLFSFEAWRTHNPFYRSYFKHVAKAEKAGERDIRFTFDGPGNRELPQILGQFRILPKHWWAGRDISQTTLEPPLGSGPYKIKSFNAPSRIVYERVENYWGKDLGVARGQDNFATLTYDYFRDPTAALEAFKKGDLDFRAENIARNWATAYDFPAVREKKVVREEFPIRSTGVMQAFVSNLRREKFKDPRVRTVLNLVFDFEEMNKTLFFGQYERVSSYFHGTELASSGVPDGQELAVLETVKGKVPNEVFTQVYRNPVNGSPDLTRDNLRAAFKLLEEAGWRVQKTDGGKPLLKNAKGEAFTIEILIDQQVYERVGLFYKAGLERLGIETTVRLVDDVQYENRVRSLDFDMIIYAWGQSLSPGNEQNDFWSSGSATISGSRNFAGIANEAVDALIQKVVFAKDRAELVAATRALDRVMLWNYFVIPQWTYSKQRTARWDRFDRPAVLPHYGVSAFPDVWWAKP